MMRQSSMIRGKKIGSQAGAYIGSFALGAGLMYLLDPDRGARRRSMLRDKLFRAYRESEEGIQKTAEYVRNRARGIAAETRAAMSSEEISDETLIARIRSAVGRVCSHPHALRITAHDGLAIVSGPILADEVDRVISAIGRVRGVRDAENHLEPHASPANVPELQGPGRHLRSGFRRENWSPWTRLWAGLGGAALAGSGFVRGGLFGIGTILGGGWLFLRSLTNLPARRMFGIGAGRRAVNVQKTINIDAPVDVVYAFFANFDNFPHFMSNIREVRAHTSGRSHWVVQGPAGVDVEWDADLTQCIPNEALAWRSVEGSIVENAGIIRFQENESGGTRVDIKMSYNPPAGAIGHAIAMLFGADPRSEMNEDLMRLKHTIETGRPPRDASKPLEQEAT